MGMEYKLPLFLALASLLVVSSMGLRILNDEKTEGEADVMNQGRMYEECLRRCQRQGGRGQSQQWQCQRRCQEEYGYDERERHRGGRWEEEDDEVLVVDDVDVEENQHQDPYWECQRRCERQGQGRYECQQRCQQYRHGGRYSTALASIAELLFE